MQSPDPQELRDELWLLCVLAGLIVVLLGAAM